MSHTELFYTTYLCTDFTPQSRKKQLHATQDEAAGTITQIQCPQHNCKGSQSFGLIRSGIPFWIMAKRSSTVTASMPIHLHIPHSHIIDRFVQLAPVLKGFSLTLRILAWPLFSFSLGI